MPDVERIRDFLNESYSELLQAAGVEEIRPPAVKDTKPPAAKTVRNKTGSKPPGTKQTKKSHSRAASKS
jgi:hypothetical protein